MNNPTMRIPIELKVQGKNVSTEALIDSGAEGQFIDSEFAKQHKLELIPLEHPSLSGMLTTPQIPKAPSDTAYGKTPTLDLNE